VIRSWGYLVLARSLADTCYAWQAKGQLRAIGTALHLKQRYGAGYQVNIHLCLCSVLRTSCSTQR